MPGSASSDAAHLGAVGAAVERARRRRPAPGTARPGPARGRAASAASPGRPRRASAAAGNSRSGPGRAPARRSAAPACRRARPPPPARSAGRAPPGPRSRRRRRCRAPGARGARTRAPATGPRRARRRPRPGRSRRRAAGGSARPRRRRRAGRRPRACSATCVGSAAASGNVSRTRPGPCGSARVRAYQSGPLLSTPGTRCAARKRSSSPPAYGARTGSRSSIRTGCPAPPAAASRAAGARAAAGRGAGVDLPDRVVELPDAGEAGREGDVGERHRRRLDQHAGVVGAARAGQRQRAGAQLGDQQPLQVPRRVADPAGQPLDPLALHEPVTDQPHRAARDVGGDVPVRGARVASGRQRLQARKPAACAAAADRWKVTFFLAGVSAGHDGRQ